MASVVFEDGGGQAMESGGTRGDGASRARSADFKMGDKKKDPYTEIEIYLRKAQEEISAVFGEGVRGGVTKEDRTRPRVPTRPLPIDGQVSPSKIRKVYTDSQKVESSQHHCSIPSSQPRRRIVPLTKKSRRVSAPAFTRPIRSENGYSSSSSEPWHPRGDPHIHEWAQGLLKDFNSLVEEEIRSLGKNTSTTSSTPCLGVPETPILVEFQNKKADCAATSASFTLPANATLCSPATTKYPAPSNRPTVTHALTSVSSTLPANITLCSPSSSQYPVPPNSPVTTNVFSHTNSSSVYSYQNFSSLAECTAANREDDALFPTCIEKVPTESVAANLIMGTSQSTNRGDHWSGERTGPFKTYTLPRSGGHRSVSLCGAGAINYRTSAAHPDDLDVNCELLRVNPRFSRSHSLDEGVGLSSWALHHLSVIDGVHGKVSTPGTASARTSQGNIYPHLTHVSEPQQIPAPPPSTPRTGASAYLNEGHYGKIRKTGYAEKHNERWRPSINSCQEDVVSNGSAVIGFSSNRNFEESDKNMRTVELLHHNNGSSALSPSDLQKGASEPWAWADQEDVCSLTERSCDTKDCPHCKTKKESSDNQVISAKKNPQILASPDETLCGSNSESTMSDANEMISNIVHVSVSVSPPDSTNNNQEDYDREMTLIETSEALVNKSGRKSEPALFGGLSASTPIDERRHTLPAPRLFGSLSFLSAPVPTFDTSSWETLPPADELDFELETKPISISRSRDPSPASLSAGSSRSLNSSLSSLSHLSIHPDNSECDSWPSSPVADHVLSPDVFINPLAMQPTKDIVIIRSGETIKTNFKDPTDKEEYEFLDKIDCGVDPLNTSSDSIQKTEPCDKTTNALFEPITGMLQLTPVETAGEGAIIFSVSIPDETAKNKTNQRFPTDNYTNCDSVDVCDNKEIQLGRSVLRENGHRLLCSKVNSMSLEDNYKTSATIPKIEYSKKSKAVKRSSSQKLLAQSELKNTKENESKSEGVRHPPQRQRSISLTDPPSALALNQNKKHVTTSTQSGPGALNDFLRAVESRIRGGSGGGNQARTSSQHLPPFIIPGRPTNAFSPSSAPPTTSNITVPSTPTVVLDAFTQTSPPPTPQSASRASSVTWLSGCGCDDSASIEPCASSLALSITEDDYCDDDDDDDDEDWSAGVSLSSSSPPATPASMGRDDSSFSLSESLDTLDLNGESGIGTVSTRPSISPPSHAHQALDLSGSNLSSEDTGLENSFERQILRRYIPNNRSGRESDHGQHYRRRRPRPRHHEQWVRQENQMTQTDLHPPTPHHAHGIEDDISGHEIFQHSNETLERSRAGSEERMMVRHTHSEPHLDAPLTPMGGSLRGVCSEAALPSPMPTSHSNRSAFTPSAPMLPTLTEDKPPIVPTGNKPPRPRHLSLGSTQQPPHSQGRACSAPALESKPQHPYIQYTPATTPSEDSSGETPVLSTRSQSAKEIAELEAIEACKWLRAAGFPQYAQMYEELQFPLDLVCVERDHAFLDRDSLQALFRRLRSLNRCAKIRLDSARKNKAEESDDEEQQCALSGNWKFQRHSRRWSRIVHDRSPTVGDKTGGLELPDDALLGQFKRSGSERLRDGAKAILRRMESIKNRKKKRQNRDVVISGPKLVDEAHMQARVAELGCVDISPDASPELSSARGTVTTSTPHPREVRQSTPGEDSSSVASDQSQSSTPLFRGRRRRRFWGHGGSGHGVEGGGGGGGGGGGIGGGGGAYSDSECSPPTWRHYFTDANSNKMTPSNQDSTGHPEKRPNKGGSLRASRPVHLRHTGSLTYGKESQAVRENFLASIRRGDEKNNENVSPLPSPDDERHSVYDNVPLIICNKSYHDYQAEGMDSEASAHEGSGSSECTVESRDSPLPSTHDDEEIDEPRRIAIDRWHSFNRKSYLPCTRQQGTQINGFSSGQTLHLRKRALLRLTALMERFCPSNRSGWNWELPKFMRKIKTPDYRDRQVFGVPLLVIAQRTGQPVPPGIQNALQYLRSTSLDQVGIFRKPGVRSRIQKLREFHELGEEILYSNFGICDIADMVKTYFRELPEVLLTNKLSEMFITIFQYLPAEHRLEALQCAVLLLPDENREVLMALLTFLADVAAHSHLNQMHASNLAVCLAPSLFHLNVGTSGSSPLRRRAGGTPEQRDLHENKAAHQCLTLMIQQVSQLQCVPIEMLGNCRFTYLEQSQPVCLEDLGVVGSPGVTTTVEGDWASYMNACITSLLKEARDKSRGWVHMNCGDSNVEILYRKVGDGHPLRLWRATTEVEAPPSELLNRVIRERHLWDESLLKWRVVTRLDRQAEVFQYMCNSMSPRPPVDYCVLRCWRSDLARGTCVVVETSVEHADAPVLVGGVRGIVLASRYLIQPCGSGKSRITHISRLDMRGRTPEWYNKVYGHATANHLTRIRQSFQHHASGPESKV